MESFSRCIEVQRFARTFIKPPRYGIEHSLRVQDISAGSQVGTRATVMQQKTQRPAQFEITEQTRQSVQCLSESLAHITVQLLLRHTKLESTVRYLGIEVDDALEMAEQTEM